MKNEIVMAFNKTWHIKRDLKELLIIISHIQPLTV